MSDGHPRDKAAGFTALEMLVALAILALIVTLALARADGARPRLTLEATARGLAYELRALRLAAIRTNRTTTLAVAADGRGFVTSTGRLIRVPAGVGAVMLAGRSIVFHADGTASEGGVLLSSGHDRRLVRVDWLTGQAAVAGGG